MAALTIRNLDDDIKAALRLQAARHGVSMEQEARSLLRSALTRKSGRSNEDGQPGRDFVRSVRAQVEPHGGFDDFPIPARSGAVRKPPVFD